MLTALSRDTRALLMALALATVFAVGGCSSSGGGGSSDDSGTTFSAPDCSGSTDKVVGTFTDDVPDWIKNNFTCVNAYVSGSNVIIMTKNLPAYTTPYYDSGALHVVETSNMPTTFDSTNTTSYLHTTNPNTISTQELTYTIPMTPVTDSADLTPTYTETTAAMGGVAVDGVAIFNAYANSPDKLSNEAWTLDNNMGHPTDKGIYHYHVEPWQLTRETDVSTRDALVGIALDGLPIYGVYDQAGTAYSGAGTKTTFTDTDHSLTDGKAANFHCHETLEFPSGVCHYHVMTGWTDPTTNKAPSNVGTGVSTELRYLVKYFAAAKGSYTMASTNVPGRGFRAAQMLATAAMCGPGGP